MNLNSIEHVAYECEKAKKVVNSFGFDSDYTLHQVLVVKAASAGIVDPFAWASVMVELLNDEKIKAI